jgi:hypothetical protein
MSKILPKVHPLRLVREVYKRIGSNNVQLNTVDYYELIEFLEEELILEWAKEIQTARAKNDV